MNPRNDSAVELFLGHLDGALEPDQAAGLDEQLAAHPELAEALVEYADLEWLVESWYARQRRDQEAGQFSTLLNLPFDFDEAAGPRGEPLVVGTDVPPPARLARAGQWARRVAGRLPRLPRLHWAHGAVAVAALVALIWFGPMVFHSRQPAAPVVAAPRVAQVTASVDALWGGATVPDEDGWLPGDTVELRRGQAEVRFASGALVVLKAPAMFQALGPLEARLTRGALRARMARGAVRFCVHTPTAKVVDLSTEFGLAVTGLGETDVAVFDGEVDVSAGPVEASRPGGPVGAPRRLTVGEGLHVDVQGQLQRLTTVTDETFPAPVAARQTAEQVRAALVTSVSDNLRDGHGLKFYRVVSGGFGEDVPAYVDRVHEWNGVKKSGLPKFLVGADYIMPFGGDKAVKDLEITVTLARPATVYVLFDDRGSKPGWLVKGFKDTGVNVGMDEGPIGRSPWKLGKGPGVSIETVFSVWKRDVLRPGPVVLGPRGEVVASRAMYGIVVVPLKPEAVETAPAAR